MTDSPLFPLNDRWRLAYDRHQWILQRRTASEAPDSAISHYQFNAYAGGEKAALQRLFREKGIELTPEARQQMYFLPEKFDDFNALKIPPFLRRVA